MNQKLFLLVVSFAVTINVAKSWNWHFKNLRGLDKGHDKCRKISETNNSEIVRYVHHSCAMFLRHFHAIPSEYQERCPGARDAKCRHLDDKWRCTVRINSQNLADPKKEELETVALRSCLKTITKWKELIEQESVTTVKNWDHLVGNATGTGGAASAEGKKKGTAERSTIAIGGATVVPKEIGKAPEKTGSRTTKSVPSQAGKQKKRKKPMGNTARPKS
ncbi:uncharacterized protein [Bemisia tabaci]|uniref:uncharacterized protein n=1 Tax=Bemisia tabaci TaxID=7038 RepID=UPI003B2850BB